MNNDEKNPSSSKLTSSFGGLAKSGATLASDGVATVVKASGKAVNGATKTLNPTNLFKKSKRKSRKDELYEGLRNEVAEEYLIERLEEKGRRTIPNGDGFRPAIEGERAPLGIDTIGNAFDEEAPLGSQPNYRTMARMTFQKQSGQKFGPTNNNNMTSPVPMNNHQRIHSLLNSINENWDENADTDPVEEAFRAPTEIIVDESHPLIGEPVEGHSSVPYQRLQEARRNSAKQRCRRILSCLNPWNIIVGLLRLILQPFLVWGFPFYASAWVLFYELGNPELDFLPGKATLSWWCNFVGRHIFLLQVSYILQTILIDWIILSSKLVLGIVGPWATIFCLQSRGWPFLVGCWGLLALCFLQGDDASSQHWLHSTGIKIYSVANSGSYIIASGTYLKVLIGMVLTGIATSLKRTIVTLYFGKKSFELYKEDMEKILNNMILISEVAELSAAAADELPESTGTSTSTSTPRRKINVRWSSLRFDDKKQNDLNDVGDDDGDDDDSDLGNSEAESNEDEAKQGNLDKRGGYNKSFSGLSPDTSVRNFRIKNLLGRWDDPLNKMDKRPPSSVSDLLKFRKALTYMDLEHPFSEAFGPASTRDELLTSAQVAYARLLRLAGEGSSTLPFSVLAVLADNADGTIDKRKRKDLKKIFPPDGNGNLSLLGFVMGCDNVYKKLRYFRASVGNSSVIDNVLENIVDSLYFFVLLILILSFLNLNPWPFLVSMSTLLVTFTFAVGPSCARGFEGIILIVGRRPYDIGDRIIISDTPGGGAKGTPESWFVEDITLFTTTLRFAANNEVATVSNGSIAQARITNCAKSLQAMVHLVMKFHIRFHDGTNLQDFRESIDQYVLNHPNHWDSINAFRCEEIDTDNDVVTYRLVVRSTQSWQPAPRVMEQRAQLDRFCSELRVKMGVSYESPMPSRIMYTGGEMVDANNPKVNRARSSGSLIEPSASQFPQALQDAELDQDAKDDEIQRALLGGAGA